MRVVRVLSSLALTAGLLLASGTATTCWAQSASGGRTGEADGARVLTNADVVQMLKAGFSDDAAIAVIQKAKTRFDLSPAALAELRYAGVSNSVIVAMVESAGGVPNAPAPPAPIPAPPAPVVAPTPQPTPEPPPLEDEDRDEDRHELRRGGVFGLSLGGQYAFEPGGDSTETASVRRFHRSAGRRPCRPARRDPRRHLRAESLPETDDLYSGGLFALGPAVRFLPAPRLSVEIGISFVAAGGSQTTILSSGPRDIWDWGSSSRPAGATSRWSSRLGSISRFSHDTECSDCDSESDGRVATQFAFTWY